MKLQLMKQSSALNEKWWQFIRYPYLLVVFYRFNHLIEVIKMLVVYECIFQTPQKKKKKTGIM